MKYKAIQELAVVYGKKERMKQFINYFREFWERDGKDIRIIQIRKNKHSWFNDLRKFIWKGD